MRGRDYMKLEIPAYSHNESFARVTVGAFLTRLNPTLEELSDVKTAVSEAVTNAIVHGYAGKPGSPVQIGAEVRGNEFIVTVSDAGVGIADLAQAMEPFYTSKPDEERSGMGFTVMQTFMDDLQVQSSPGRGTTVRMVKRLSPVGAEEPMDNEADAAPREDAQ